MESSHVIPFTHGTNMRSLSIAQLYNLKEDLAEQANLADRMPKKAAELLKELEQWRVSVVAQLPTPNPKHDPEYGSNGF